MRKNFLKKFQYFIFEDRYYLITKVYLLPQIIFDTIKKIFNMALKEHIKFH